jgi:flagellin-like hook-associated protein FlgL
VRVALQNNDTTALQTAQANLQTAASYLNQQQEFYGNVENRITASLTNVNNASVSLQTNLSNRTDADETAVIVEMQQYTTTLQAAIAAEAKMPTTTLFDELPS